MDRKNILLVSTFAIVAIIIGLLVPKGDRESHQIMPWQIDHTETGSTRVFGLTLDESTLADAEQRLGSKAEVSLFAKPDGEMVTEVFFEKVELGGLSAKVVIVTGLDQNTLKAMYDRGERISTLGSGTNKVTLSLPDLELIRQAPIASITYLPRIDIQPEVIEKRFGVPAEKIMEESNNTTHWLYPGLGLDISLNSSGDAVLQYVSPKKFELLRTPLLQLQQEQTTGGEAAN